MKRTIFDKIIEKIFVIIVFINDWLPNQKDKDGFLNKYYFLSSETRGTATFHFFRSILFGYLLSKEVEIVKNILAIKSSHSRIGWKILKYVLYTWNIVYNIYLLRLIAKNEYPETTLDVLLSVIPIVSRLYYVCYALYLRFKGDEPRSNEDARSTSENAL